MIEQINQALGNITLNPGVGHKYSGFNEKKEIVSINVLEILSNPIIDSDIYYEIELSEGEANTKTKIKKEDLKDLIIKMGLTKK